MIAQTLAPATLPPGQRIYAIGDVHGWAGRLAELHSLIRDDLRRRPVADATVVHLGDYVDRGPDSAGVVEMLLEPWPGDPVPAVVALMGNHEDMMLTALETGDPAAVEQWLANGGDESLMSWGLSPDAPPASWLAGLPAAHLDFLRNLQLTYRAGGYVFVHAGIRPGLALDDQQREDLLWIREPFLSWKGKLPAVIVHGHTPTGTPSMRRNRIGIDTGAAFGGRLTCAVLERETLGFLQA